MKFLGQKKNACYCHYCTGDNNSKAVHKALRHKGRQESRKEEKEWTLVHSRTKKKENFQK